MRVLLIVFVFGILSVGGTSGCVIGTWPTPEGRKDRTIGPDHSPVGDEACDDVDEDGDGSYDEGCPCTEDRGCVGVVDGECGPGIQRCLDGVWQECGDVGLPRTPVRELYVGIVSVTPEVIVRGQTSSVTVVVESIAACDAFEAPAPVVSLSTAAPAMTVQANANDDGVGSDATAGDGLYTAQIPIPFGPGVAAQPVTVTATARLSNSTLSATESATFEEAP